MRSNANEAAKRPSLREASELLTEEQLMAIQRDADLAAERIVKAMEKVANKLKGASE